MTEARTQAAGALWRLPVNARSHTSPCRPRRTRLGLLLELAGGPEAEAGVPLFSTTWPLVRGRQQLPLGGSLYGVLNLLDDAGCGPFEAV